MIAQLIDQLSQNNHWENAVEILAALPGNY